MERKPIIETLREKESGRMPEIVFGEEGIGLVALGSAACIRTVYFYARKMQCLDRFDYCFMSKTDYALGNSYKIRRTLEHALSRPGIKGTVLYTSCMESITAMDLEQIVKQVHNPESIPVKIFYRGPMTARRFSPREDLKRILQELSLYDRKSKGSGKDMEEAAPLLASDFSAVLSMLQEFPFERLLVTPGGCANCLKPEKMGEHSGEIKFTKFDDLQLSIGCEGEICEAAAECMDKSRLLCCVGSAVPEVVGMNCRSWEKKLKESGVRSIWLGCDGFHFGPSAVSKSLLELGNRWTQTRRLKTGGKHILILGKYDVGLPDTYFFSRVRERLEKSGYICVTFGELWKNDLQNKIAYIWPWTAEALALAREWSLKFEIPLLNQKKWENIEDIDLNFMEKVGKIHIITEPLLGSCYERLLKEKGYDTVLHVYAPDSETADFYRCALGEDTDIFSDVRQMKISEKESAAVITDPILAGYLKQCHPDLACIPLSYPMISGVYDDADMI